MLPSPELVETLLLNLSPEPRHETLVKTIRQRTRLDTLRFAAVREGYSNTRRQQLVIAKDGSILGRLNDWLPTAFAEANHDIATLWARLQESGLRVTENTMDRLVFVAPYGSKPAEFIQLEVWLSTYTVNQRIVSDSLEDRPIDLNGLLAREYFSGDVHIDPEPLGLPRYEFGCIFDVAKHCREIAKRHEIEQYERELISVEITKPGQAPVREAYFDAFPEERDRQPAALRLFDDWAKSSAGHSGAEFCDNWFVDHSDWTDPADGSRYLSLIPQWTQREPPPRIGASGAETVYGLWDTLIRFDRTVGYPMAWYFFMLHGNRIADNVGEAVLKGVEDGHLVLPEHDVQVLRRWYDTPYGF